MTAALGVIQLAALAFIFFALTAALLCGGLTARLLKRFERLEPTLRVRSLLAFVSAPALLALTCTLACFTPSLLSGVLPGLDHCLHHAGHPHLCLEHLPASSGQPLGWVLIAAAGVYLAFRAARGTRALLHARELLATLTASTHPGAHRRTLQVDRSTPFCLAAGLFHPTVIVSRGLLERLPAAELEAVLAHEHAHARRHDALLLLAARCLAVFHLPHARERLIDELEVTCEIACDEEAARSVGDRLVIAGAIVAVTRLMQGQPQPAGVGLANFGVRALDVRVKALLDEPRTGRLVPGVFVIVGAISLLALLCADPLHHATETLLSAFTH